MKLWAWVMAVVYMWKRRTVDRPGWELESVPDKSSAPQFQVVRKWFNETTTISELLIEGIKKCYMLEDCVRHEKIAGKTAIPEGTYEVIVSYSNRFKKHLPLLLNVPNYKGIRIHPGNTHNDTAGCLLPGMEKDDTNRTVFYSRKAFNDIFELLKVMCAHEKVWIKIKNERTEAV